MRRRRDNSDRGSNMINKFQSGGKVYRILATISMLGIFLAAGILVLSGTGVFEISAAIFGTVAMIGILCLAITAVLPWVQRIEKNENKIVSIVFISVIAACAVLWIVCDWLIVAIVTNHNAGIALLWSIKIAIILSLQLMVADVVAAMLIRFKKTFLILQCITYFSFVFIDFYFTFLVCCIRIVGEEVKISDAFAFLGSPAMITLIVLAFVYASISNFILKRMQQSRLRNMVNNYYDGGQTTTAGNDVREVEVPQETIQEMPKETPEEKLEKLKKLYDQQLISQEDYEAKKAEIIKDL